MITQSVIVLSKHNLNQMTMMLTWKYPLINHKESQKAHLKNEMIIKRARHNQISSKSKILTETNKRIKRLTLMKLYLSKLKRKGTNLNQ